MSEYDVILTNVSKRFGSRKIINDLSAKVRTGTICGFLGPNGAGKTTVMRMMLGIFRPDSGCITVLGKAHALEKVRKFVGYMPEERGLYHGMSVRGVLRFIAAISQVPHLRCDRVIDRWLGCFGLSDTKDLKIAELSRGMQQQIQFLATVLHDPQLLVLDEPFANLDPANQDHLKRVLMELRASGRTIIISTHNMTQAEHVCDHVVLISKGRKLLDESLPDACATYPFRMAEVELDSEYADLPMIEGIVSISRQGDTFQVRLDKSVDPSAFVAQLADTCRVSRVKVRDASLRDVFMEITNGELS